MVDQELTGSRAELQAVLLEQRGFLTQLLDRAADPHVPAGQLVDLVDVLERLDDRRDQLLQALREEASDARRRQEERSIRQFVLRALDEIEWPQNAGFLQEYVWARERVDLNTRGFGALRRDERRAWGRNPGRRLAYIVSALDDEGRPLSRWMARSDWPLERRLVLRDDERLLELMKLRALFAARRERDPSDLADPYESLIEKYGAALFELEPPPVDDRDGRERWLEDVGHLVDGAFDLLATDRAARSRAAAERIAAGSEEEQVWGVLEDSV
jgi:hypothetical protein